MHFVSLIALPALAAAAAIPVDYTSGTAPDPSTVHIRSVAYGGTGCPQGSVASIISEDATTMTLIFDSYVASMGKGVSITQNRKNCQLNIDLLYPSGFQYSVFSADYRGYVSLDKGVNGTQQSTYYFSGQTAQASTGTIFVGPISGQDYLIHDTAQSVSAILSPCGAEGLLNVNSQVRLTGASGLNGLMTTDSIDTKFTQIIYLGWQKC